MSHPGEFSKKFAAFFTRTRAKSKQWSIHLEGATHCPGDTLKGRVTAAPRMAAVRGTLELVPVMHHREWATKVFGHALATQELAFRPGEEEVWFELEVPADVLTRKAPDFDDDEVSFHGFWEVHFRLDRVTVAYSLVAFTALEERSGRVQE